MTFQDSDDTESLFKRADKVLQDLKVHLISFNLHFLNNNYVETYYSI